MSKNLAALSYRKGMEDNLFSRYVDLAQEEGSPDEEALKKTAREYLQGDSSVLGAVSSYDFLKDENQGKKVYLCSGTACKMADTQEALKKTLCKTFKEEEIGEMVCLGRCHENSAFTFGQDNYSGLLGEAVTEIVAKGKTAPKDEY